MQVDTGRSGEAGKGGKAQADANMVASHVIPDKPLDFSFLKITNVLALKSTDARGGKRKPIIQDDDEEE